MSDQRLIGKSTSFKGDPVGVSYRAATPHTFLERRYSTAALVLALTGMTPCLGAQISRTTE
jgi:hypothetical protein